jgi:hypothetical protein
MNNFEFCFSHKTYRFLQKKINIVHNRILANLAEHFGQQLATLCAVEKQRV